MYYPACISRIRQMSSKVAFAFLLVALLAGCDRGTTPSAAQPVASRSDGVAPASTPLAGISASPDSVKLCEVRKGVPTTVRWDVSASGASKVILTVQNPKTGTEKRFGHGGAVGTKQTGPWLRPGLTFKVRDQANNAELGSVTIKGIACN